MSLELMKEDPRVSLELIEEAVDDSLLRRDVYRCDMSGAELNAERWRELWRIVGVLRRRWDV